MHVFIIAAKTADGFIARAPKVGDATAVAPAVADSTAQVSTAWTSAEDKRRFVELTKRAGVVVMGSTTYKTFNKPLKDRRNIIYDADGALFPGTETTQKPPADLLRQLESEGVKEVAICGGCSIYTLFMRSGLVNTVYLTIEPIFFGTGIGLFNQPIEQKLSLVSCEKTEHNTLLLEYKVEPRAER